MVFFVTTETSKTFSNSSINYQSKIENCNSLAHFAHFLKFKARNASSKPLITINCIIEFRFSFRNFLHFWSISKNFAWYLFIQFKENKRNSFTRFPEKHLFFFNCKSLDVTKNIKNCQILTV